MPFQKLGNHLHNTAAPANRLAPGAPTFTRHFSTKLAYSKLLEKRYLPPTVQPRILNHAFTKESIQEVYLLPFRILKEAKLIMFQVKIINGILPTQSSFFRTGLTDFDTCPLCNLESQSLPHMLWVREFLEPFYSLLADNFSPNYSLIRKRNPIQLASKL